MVGGKTVSRPETKRFPWGAVIALAMGMLVYGVAESYGPVSAIGKVFPQNLAYIAFSLPYIAGGVGALLAGYMADKMGRRNAFLIASLLILLGIIIYIIGPTNIPALIISFILIGMAAIGLETPILSIIAETIPAKWRGNTEVIVQNFGNLGVALLFIPLFLNLSSLQVNAAIALLFLAPLAALVIGYFMVSESKPWKALAKGGNVEQAWRSMDGDDEPIKPSTSIGLRFATLMVLGIVQDVAFLYITYGIGFLYFSSNLANSIPIIGGLTMVVVGVIFGASVHRMSRRKSTLWSYGLLALFWAVLWAYVAITGDNSGITLVLLTMILFIFVETTWGTRAMLEPEIFPTRKRGTYISYVRAVVWIIAGAIFGILTLYTLSFSVEAAIVMLIFAIGLAMSIVWYLKGFETSRRSLVSHDVKKV
ncbi:MAG: MFS transporter [Candidatus Micrarchaeaceae archaeon]